MTTTFTGEIHPFLADLPIFDSEVEAIAESIQEVGLLHPITLDTEGRVIGGRHRLAACERANVEPEFEFYEDDPLAFMLHDNATRKHQSTGQRAAENALTLDSANQRSNGRWDYGRVANDETLHRSSMKKALAQAGFILDHLGREALNAIAEGNADIHTVYQQAEQRRDAERQKLEHQKRLEAEEADSRAFVEENAPDLAAQVGDVFQSYVEAHDVWKRRNREEAERIRREEREQREREAAERRNDEEQARMIGSLLEQVSFLEYETQRAWCIEATGKYPEVLPSNHKKLHTPSRIRELAEAINTYATELENSYARTT